MMKDDDFKLLRGFDDGRTIFVNVELLLQLRFWSLEHSRVIRGTPTVGTIHI